MSPTLKAWDGTMFTQKTLEVWDGSAFVEKPLKVWDGTQWALVGGTPAVLGVEHSISPNTAVLSTYTDGTPRIRLGSWFYTTGLTELSCVGAKVYVPEGSPAIGGKVRMYGYLRTAGYPANGGDINFNDYLQTKDADISAAGWVTVHWDSAFDFYNGNSGFFVFIAYEFLTAGGGYTGIYHAGNLGNNDAVQSTTLGNLFLAEPAIRSGFAQGSGDNMSGGTSSLWFGVDIIVNDNTAITGDQIRLFANLTASAFSNASEQGITYNLGTEFYITKQAWLTEIRFMMPTSGNGSLNPREVSLWRVDGGNSGTRVVGPTSVTPPGYGAWATHTLPTPYLLDVGQRYRAVVRLDAEDGYVTISNHFGALNDFLNAYLVAPNAVNATANDQGSFTAAGDVFPTESFNNSFYGIDVTVVDTLEG